MRITPDQALLGSWRGGYREVIESLSLKVVRLVWRHRRSLGLDISELLQLSGSRLIDSTN